MPAGIFYLAPPNKTASAPVKCAESFSGSTSSYEKRTLATLFSEDFNQLKGVLKEQFQPVQD